MKIVIIGAGVSGLVTLKYALDSGHECDIFEQTGDVGGAWFYTPECGIDKYGFPVHSSMYEGLRTNIPKELMNFLDFQYPSHISKSFISHSEVLQYLRCFADTFRLEKEIQFYKCVTRVEPIEKSWIVTVTDVKSKTSEKNTYDAVFVCNGHFFDPRIPGIRDDALFQGLQMHSHCYRVPGLFKHKTVLIVGASYSAIDIAKEILNVANKVCLSHWRDIALNVPDIPIKPSISQFTKDGVIFSDNTQEDFDIILYCTGYNYKYPFLTAECGIIVDDNWVRNLYKQVISIENPTLFFIGIPFLTCAFFNVDLQARFALAVLEGKFVLPPKENMIKELEEHTNDLRRRNVPQRHTHMLGMNQAEYFKDLAETAGIRPIPEVISNLYKYFLTNINNPEITKVKYVLLDDEKFEIIKLQEEHPICASV